MRLPISAVALAAAALAAPAQAQQAPASMVLQEGTLLEIVAEGSTTRVPDLAVIRAGVVTQAATAAAALSENAQRITAVLAALKRAGIAERDVQTANISLNPQYRYQENQPPVITGYQASNTVSIRFRDVKKSGAILDALVGQGANQIDGPNLTIDQPEAALDQARADAVAKARARAELYARAAGLRVDRILSISEGSDMPRPPMPVMAMARAESDSSTKIAPGEQDVTVALSVRFLLR